MSTPDKDRAGRASSPVIIPFPVRVHVGVDKLARRLLGCDPRCAATYLRNEIQRAAERRIAKGIPAAVVAAQALDLERVVIERVVTLKRQGGNA
jgi:hypothetical protein